MNRWISRLFLALCLALPLVSCTSTPTQESAGEVIDDATITTRVKAAIFQDPALKVFQINVTTFKGVVQLSGFVDSALMVDHAAEVAKSVKGVKSVTNSLIIK